MSKKEGKERPAGQMSLRQMFQRVPASSSQAAPRTTSPPSAAADSTPLAAPTSTSALAPASTSTVDTLRSKIVHRTDRGEFEVRLSGGPRAYLSYAYVASAAGGDNVVLDLQHTSVPGEYRGQGIAGMLVQRAFEFARDQNVRVRPTCTYIHTFLKQHPHWRNAVESAREDEAGDTARNQPLPARNNGGEHGKSFHKHHVTGAKVGSSSTLHPASATRRHDRADDTEGHSGDKRRSPSAEHDATRVADWHSKKVKLSDPASSAAAAASAAAASTSASSAAASSKPAVPASPIPHHHVPLPFNAMFAKKWSNTLAAIATAQSLDDAMRSSAADAGGITDAAFDASTPAQSAADDVVDLMRRISFSKREIDLRCLGMKYFFDVYIGADERTTFLRQTVPFLIALIRDLPNTFDASRPENANIASYPPGCLPILRTHVEQSLSLTKRQVLSLLACSFFGLQAEHMPVARRDGSGAPPMRRFNSSNFDGLWINIGRAVQHHLRTNDTAEEIRSENQTEVQKMRCIMAYFDRMRQRVRDAEDVSHPNARLYGHILAGSVTYHRKSLQLSLADMEARLMGTTGASASRLVSCDTDLRPLGTIEDDGFGTLEIDFANKFIGGGVLTGGCIQEEIRFTINPECLVSLLFVEVMSENESVAIIGPERFTDYTGYSRTFEYAGVHVDHTPIDPTRNRMKTVIVAIDAIAFRRKTEQYEKRNILREILKAYAGFALEESVIGVQQAAGTAGRQREEEMVRAGTAITSYVDTPASAATAAADATPMSVPFKSGVTDADYSFQAVSTGNWGCGAFGGEVPLKMLIQLLAATLARRSLRYFTFGSDACAPLPKIVQVIDEKKPTVKQLYLACIRYHPLRAHGRQPHEFISDLLDGSDARKQEDWHAKQARAKAEAAAAASKAQAAHSIRPLFARQSHAAAAAAAGTSASAAASVRHANLASSTAADSIEFNLDDDPIVDFPPSDVEEDGYDTESERALREAEMDEMAD